jgi:hypothetical protein
MMMTVSTDHGIFYIVFLIPIVSLVFCSHGQQVDTTEHAVAPPDLSPTIVRAFTAGQALSIDVKCLAQDPRVVAPVSSGIVQESLKGKRRGCRSGKWGLNLVRL